jgi:hypothetical protein
MLNACLPSIHEELGLNLDTDQIQLRDSEEHWFGQEGIQDPSPTENETTNESAVELRNRDNVSRPINTINGSLQVEEYATIIAVACPDMTKTQIQDTHLISRGYNLEDPY